MAAHALPERREIGRGGHGLAEGQGHQILRQDVPRRRCRFGAVERIGVRDALAPPGRASLVHGDQHELSCGHAAEARLERPHERQAQHGEVNGADAHCEF